MNDTLQDLHTQYMRHTQAQLGNAYPDHMVSREDLANAAPRQPVTRREVEQVVDEIMRKRIEHALRMTGLGLALSVLANAALIIMLLRALT